MAVIELNLLACIRPNEVDGGGIVAWKNTFYQVWGDEGGVVCLKHSLEGSRRGFKNSCHPVLPSHHGDNRSIAMWNSSFLPVKAMRGQMEVIYLFN